MEKLKKSAKLTKEDIVIIKASYQEGFSINVIGGIFGVDRATVRWHLLREGVYSKGRLQNKILKLKPIKTLGEFINKMSKKIISKEKQKNEVVVLETGEFNPGKSYADYVRETTQISKKEKESVLMHYNSFKRRYSSSELVSLKFMRPKKIFKPMGTGWIQHTPDSRDANWNLIFGAAAAAPPAVFTRPVPNYVPYQNGIQCCVWCTLAKLQEHNSSLESHNIELSFRMGYAGTPGGTGGRSYRWSADYLRHNGIPESSYCPNDVTINPTEFLNVSSFINPIETVDSKKFAINNYSFLTDLSLDSLKAACYRSPIAIAFPGNNPDWSKPKDQIVTYSGSHVWDHSVLLWDWTENYLGVLNWWGDRYRMLANSYPITAAMSLEDLPDNWQQLNMLQIIGNKQDNKQYLLGNDKVLRWIFSEALLEELNASGVVDKNNVIWVDNLDGYQVGSPWAVLK